MRSPFQFAAGLVNAFQGSPSSSDEIASLKRSLFETTAALKVALSRVDKWEKAYQRRESEFEAELKIVREQANILRDEVLDLEAKYMEAEGDAEHRGRELAEDALRRRQPSPMYRDASPIEPPEGSPGLDDHVPSNGALDGDLGEAEEPVIDLDA